MTMSRLTEEHANLLGEERLHHLIGNLEEKKKAFWYTGDPQGCCLTSYSSSVGS